MTDVTPPTTLHFDQPCSDSCDHQYVTPPTTDRGCGCSCGCHNTTHTGQVSGCRNEAKWLPEYKVWACDGCLEVCDD